jgi:hypothetical protein
VKKCALQIKPDGSLHPFSQEDLEKIRSFAKPNQIVIGHLYGTKKARSLQQNKWIHAMFRLVAENSTYPEWDTPEKVKRNVKLAMKFFANEVIVAGNKVYFQLRSFAFDEMEQNEANIRYEEAKLICARHLKVDPAELEARAREE